MKSRVISIFLLIQLFQICMAEGSEPSKFVNRWRYKGESDSVSRHLHELDSLFILHETWLNSNSEFGKRLELEEGYFFDLIYSDGDFSNANLRSIDCRGARFYNCDFSNADLSSSKLDQSIFVNCSFNDAIMNHASFRLSVFVNSDLSYCDLTSATLFRAAFVNSILDNSDMSNSNCSETLFSDMSEYYKIFGWNKKVYGDSITNVEKRITSLRNANMKNTNIRNSYFQKSMITGLLFEADSLPIIQEMSRAKGLKSLRYDTDPSKLVALKDAFAKNGYRQIEREITCALQRSHQNIFGRVFLDLPFEYGANLSRPFQIVLFIYLICTPLYYIFFHFNKCGKFKIIFFNTDGKISDDFLAKSYSSAQRQGEKISLLKWELILWKNAIVFSLLNTFNLSFREVDIGKWIQKLLPRKREYHTFGPIRSLAGFQSILCVLLMVFGIIFYFGRIFN